MYRSARSNIQRTEVQLGQSELVLCFGRQVTSLDLKGYQLVVEDLVAKGSNVADAAIVSISRILN
jgi:hypothetical protein